jgi:hypothetical protein
LTHFGTFLLRDRESTLDPSIQRLIPTNAEMATALQALQEGNPSGARVGGVIVYAAGPDSKELSPATQVTRTDETQTFRPIFAGYGENGLWRLELGNLNLHLITDIELVFSFTIYESDPLSLGPKVKDLVKRYEEELAAGDALDKISVFSLKYQFPSAFSQLQTGAGSLNLTDAHFAAGMTALTVKAVIMMALNSTGKGVEGVTLEMAKPDAAFTRTRTTAANGFSENVNAAIPVLPPPERFPLLGTWQMRLPDPSQFSQLGDLLLFFLYEYREL